MEHRGQSTEPENAGVEDGGVWEVDTSTPSVARMYDAALGGKDNFSVDRQANRDMAHGVPDIVATARANRAFLGRGVRYLAREAGIGQFLDHGSGLPTQLNVHEVAHQENPHARVVYVDNDPAVLAHGRALLDDTDHTTVINADMARPDDILDHPHTRGLLDLSQPVAALYVSVLHCVPDNAAPDTAVTRLLDALPSGSYLMLSHLVSERTDAAAFLTDFMRERTTWGRVRTSAEVTRFFTGLDLIEPGLLDITQWRPAPESSAMHTDTGTDPVAETAHPELSGRIYEFGGIARKP